MYVYYIYQVLLETSFIFNSLLGAGHRAHAARKKDLIKATEKIINAYNEYDLPK